jgi:16S rRNA C1402 N4-methylase RsmH
LNTRAIVPTPGEVADNPRARSGKLRAARKLRAGEEGD